MDRIYKNETNISGYITSQPKCFLQKLDNGYQRVTAKMQFLIPNKNQDGQCFTIQYSETFKPHSDFINEKKSPTDIEFIKANWSQLYLDFRGEVDFTNNQLIVKKIFSHALPIKGSFQKREVAKRTESRKTISSNPQVNLPEINLNKDLSVLMQDNSCVKDKLTIKNESEQSHDDIDNFLKEQDLQQEQSEIKELSEQLETITSEPVVEPEQEPVTKENNFILPTTEYPTPIEKKQAVDRISRTEQDPNEDEATLPEADNEVFKEFTVEENNDIDQLLNDLDITHNP